MIWTATLIGILGLWLIIVPFLNLGHTGNFLNDLAVGLLVATAAFAVIGRRPGLGWTGALVRVWMIFAARRIAVTAGREI